MITNLLPVLDDFERSLSVVEDDSPFVDGIQLVYRNFVKTLTGQGLEPMQVVGEEFDPEKHDAIMQKEIEGVESHIVLEEVQKGYIFNGRVVRHAKVIVSG